MKMGALDHHNEVYNLEIYIIGYPNQNNQNQNGNQNGCFPNQNSNQNLNTLCQDGILSPCFEYNLEFIKPRF